MAIPHPASDPVLLGGLHPAHDSRHYGDCYGLDHVGPTQSGLLCHDGAVPRLSRLLRSRAGPNHRDAGLGFSSLHQYTGRQPARFPQARAQLPSCRTGNIRYTTQFGRAEVDRWITNRPSSLYEIPLNQQVFFVFLGKWFNYGIIFLVMLFDLNMWKNQIFYR